MLTYSDVENIVKEKGDCGIHGEKLRKIIDFFNYNIENNNFDKAEKDLDVVNHYEKYWL